MRLVALRGAAVASLIVGGVSPGYADTDFDWAKKGFAANATVDTPGLSQTVMRRSKVTFSGLARADESNERKPARNGDGSGCVPGQLQNVLNDLVVKFGSVKVTSTCRSASANRAAGGAPQSLHLIGQAVDFRVSGYTRAVMAFLSAHGDVGGLKHYGGGLYHIDSGARRPF